MYQPHAQTSLEGSGTCECNETIMCDLYSGIHLQGLHRLEKYLNIQDCLENLSCL